ncbi:DNA polymerase III subunit delta [Priestia koreensis]|uniref:DNA polymerase III subunit delta n=1 Tax=Priestia koreensis TaxID=284581 RepID=UPI003F52BA38
MIVTAKSTKKEGALAPIYLLHGTNTFILNEQKKKIIDQALNEEELEFNLSNYDLEDTPIEVAIEDAETLPFFGDRRVVVLNRPVFLTAEKTKEKIEHNLDKLQAYIEEPAPFSVVIIMATYEKLDERKKVTKLLKKNASCIEANEMGERELRSFIIDRLGENSVDIEDFAVDLLLQLTGLKLSLVINELDKLTMYIGEGGMIKREHVEKLVPKTLEQNVFALVEAVVKRQVSDALVMYDELVRNNEEPIKILALLVSQFRLLYHTKQLSAQGYGQQQIAQTLKVHPFRVKLAMQQSRGFEENELKGIMKDLANADYEMKTGKMNKSLILQLFFLQRSAQ